MAPGICMRKAARNAVCDSMCTALSFTQKRRTKLVEQSNKAKVETETKFNHKSKTILKTITQLIIDYVCKININNIYLLQLGCYLVAVVNLHVYKI